MGVVLCGYGKKRWKVFTGMGGFSFLRSCSKEDRRGFTNYDSVRDYFIGWIDCRWDMRLNWDEVLSKSTFSQFCSFSFLFLSLFLLNCRVKSSLLSGIDLGTVVSVTKASVQESRVERRGVVGFASHITSWDLVLEHVLATIPHGSRSTFSCSNLSILLSFPLFFSFHVVIDRYRVWTRSDSNQNQFNSEAKSGRETISSTIIPLNSGADVLFQLPARLRLKSTFCNRRLLLGLCRAFVCPIDPISIDRARDLDEVCA